MKENIETMLDAKDKGLGRAKNLVSRLWRKILFDLNITGNRWNIMLTKYVNDPRNCNMGDVKRKSWTRGNLNSELTGDEMTFYSLEKGIRLLGIQRLTLTLTAEWKSGFVTNHSVGAVVEDEFGDDQYLLEQIILRSDEELVEALFRAYRNNPKRLDYIINRVNDLIKQEKP